MNNPIKSALYFLSLIFLLFISNVYAADIQIKTNGSVSLVVNTVDGSFINCSGTTFHKGTSTYIVDQYQSGSTYCEAAMGVGPDTAPSPPSGRAIYWSLGPEYGYDNGTKSFSLPDLVLPAGNYYAFVYACLAGSCNATSTDSPYRGGIVKSSIFSMDGIKPLSSITIPTIPNRSQIVVNDICWGCISYNSFCVGILSADSGKIYGTGKPYSCSNAGEPAPPVNCTINNNSPVNINLGSIQQSDIGTSAGGNGLVSKNVPVTCDSTGNVSATLKLTYTPLAGSGDAAVSTSSNNLGVSVRYNSAVWANNATKNLTLTPGNNSLNLDFTPVVRAGVTSDQIPVGNYTASASLVMTWQ